MQGATDATTLNPYERSRGELQTRYDAAGSVAALARVLKVPRPAATKMLRQSGIEIRSSGYASPRLNGIKHGPEHHNWKGGTYMHGNGYVYEYAPDHPTATRKMPYVLQHRLVMEQTLGRFLEPDEDVHHEDEDKTNNDPANLVLTKRSPHMAHHRARSPRDDKGRFA
jgi:hypothetical protein